MGSIGAKAPRRGILYNSIHMAMKQYSIEMSGKHGRRDEVVIGTTRLHRLVRAAASVWSAVFGTPREKALQRMNARVALERGRGHKDTEIIHALHIGETVGRSRKLNFQLPHGRRNKIRETRSR